MKDSFTLNVIKEHKLIRSLANNEFKTRFAGSYFGLLWAFLQPLVTVLVYWFVFGVGFKSSTATGYPFSVWLVSGIVPWFYFAEGWALGSRALLDYSFLVKKVVFKIDILPVVKSVSSIYMHFIFIGIALVFNACFGYYPSVYSIQLVYYVLCTFALVVALSYLCSALVVFFQDLNQIIGIVLQVAIWMTPIMWSLETMNLGKWGAIFKLNPMYYIVDGFRDSLLYGNWVFDKWKWTIYFWALTLVLYFIGTRVFKKLKPHYADIL